MSLCCTAALITAATPQNCHRAGIDAIGHLGRTP
jgi:hypothetical protein